MNDFFQSPRTMNIGGVNYPIGSNVSSSIAGFVPGDQAVAYQQAQGGLGNLGAANPNLGLGFNAPTLGLGLQGLSTIGNLWGALQANKLAKKQFEYTKGVTDTNLKNSISSYNTALEDRITSRAAQEGQSTAERDAYLDKHRLSR